MGWAGIGAENRAVKTSTARPTPPTSSTSPSRPHHAGDATGGVSQTAVLDSADHPSSNLVLADTARRLTVSKEHRPLQRHRG